MVPVDIRNKIKVAQLPDESKDIRFDHHFIIKNARVSCGKLIIILYKADEPETQIICYLLIYEV